MIVPSPGVASWFTATQTSALLRSSGGAWPAAENIFISIHQRQHGHGSRDERADTKAKDPRKIEQQRKKPQAAESPPVFGDDLAAQLHRVPEANSLIDD